VVAVGDIFPESGDLSHAEATSRLIDQIHPSAILGLGDYQYTTGDCANFLADGHFDSVWGTHNSIMYPVFGPDHDYDQGQANAAGYMSHQCPGQKAPAAAGAASGSGHMQWNMPYSYDLGDWHLIALPSLCFTYPSGCDAAQVTNWLESDLATRNAKCTIAYWHQPYWTSPSDEHTRTAEEKPWVQALYDHGVELLLTGHQHFYERFNRQDPNDKDDPVAGIRSFIVGTGGMVHYHKNSTAPNEAAYNDTDYGVLKLSLGNGAYSWQFMPVQGGHFTDSGTGTCH
jgi:hypothetical protein